MVDGDVNGPSFSRDADVHLVDLRSQITLAAMVDEKGSVVIFRDTPTEVWLERLARATVVEGCCGCNCPRTYEGILRQKSRYSEYHHTSTSIG